jgi:signal transduction histidine kinase
MERRKSLTMKKELLNVAELLDKLVEYHRLKSSKEVTFDIRIDPSHLQIFADATHIGNVMNNLIDNAIKYSADKVEIMIEVTETDKMSRIAVSDHGIGIEHDNLDRLFDKFYRVPSGNMQQVRGYGLGLYYVKQIMEKHGGSVVVQSEPGKGSTFTLLLPKRT